MERQNLASAEVEVEHRTREPWGRVLETATQLRLTEQHNFDSLLLGRSVSVLTTWLHASQLRPQLAGQVEANRFDDREMGDGSALERTGRVYVQAALSGDPRSTVSGRLRFVYGRGDGTPYLMMDGAVVVRPSPRLDLEVVPDLIHSSGEPRFVGADGANPDRLLFGRLDATQVGGTLRATLTFTPRLTLQGYTQLFVARGHFTEFLSYARAPGTRPQIRLDALQPTTDAPPANPDFQRAGINATLVLRWEFALGSTAYLVYTRTQTPQILLQPGARARLDFTSLPRAPAADVLLLKLTWWWA
jgi:hypothetical protein